MGQYLAKIKCECLYNTVVPNTYVLYYDGIGAIFQWISQIKRVGLLKFTCLHD